MPLYEYYCRECKSKFELLRPMSGVGEPATCTRGHEGAERVLSVFAAHSQGEAGERVVVGGGGCAACAGGHCACGGR